MFSVRTARRVQPDGSFRTDIIVTVQQRRPVGLAGDGDLSNGFFWFRGGATLVLDPNAGNPRIRYAIIKNCDSQKRIAIQRSMETSGHLSPLRALYFGDANHEPFAMMHASGEERDHD